jgi:D-aminoacyl-tRNA deacylase
MKEFLIINSQRDPAGTNILQRIIENYEFRKTELSFDSNPVYSYQNIFLASSRKEIVNVGSELDESFGSASFHYIFISKHRAESQIPSLTAHFTGNFGSNDFGGNPREISKYSPSMLKHYLQTLNSMKNEIAKQYNLTLEATHHGPTSLRRPSMFVELGSLPEQWKDEKVAKCIAKALMTSLKTEERYDRCAIALGGTHYPEKFNRLILETEIALGVVVPKYALESLDGQMLSQIIQKSEEKITIAALDNKGLGKHKNRILELLDPYELEILRI